MVETNAPEAQVPLTGWAQLTRQPSLLTVVFNVSGMATIRGSAGVVEDEATAAFQTENPSSWVLAFDNTRRHATGIAVANLASLGGDAIVILRDDNGTKIGEGKLSLPARGHRGLVLDSEYSLTSGRRGTVEIQPPAGGQIGVFGVRAGPAFSLASIPPIGR